MTTFKVCALNRAPNRGISIGMGEWKQVGENLVKHWGGTIYLRAKVRGKVIRQSLETCSLRVTY
jgi:hypothetical protein